MNELVPVRELSADDGREDPEAAAFLRLVGERVRTARTRKAMSRKTLAERSGVSQRYLAQLESGIGNISIALLRRVATALDHRVEWLVGADDPWTSEIASISALYRAASSELRTKVRDLLAPEHSERARAQRVALIGLRGAGKSTLGREAARALDLRFVELNAEIEEASGMPIQEVIALYGPDGYRRLERDAVGRLAAANETMILAVAGGIVSEPETYAQLLRAFHTIWLRATPDDHMARVRAQGDLRPMAGNPAAMDELRATLASREALYARADGTLMTSGKTEDEALRELLALIEDRGFLSR